MNSLFAFLGAAWRIFIIIPLASASSDMRSRGRNFSSAYKLVDIVLGASLDGKFHAFNRTSGKILWSHSSPFLSSSSSFNITGTVQPGSAYLSALINTSPSPISPSSNQPTGPDDSTPRIEYILEPQSGVIHLLHPASPPCTFPRLERLPFSMAELVRIAPFTSVTSDNDVKVFVGRKEQYTLSIELETGKMVRCDSDAERGVHAGCAFNDGFEGGGGSVDDILAQDPNANADVPKSDRGGILAPRANAKRRVYISRTDYYVSVHARPSQGRPRPPVQELSFSTYSPHPDDEDLQSTYTKTKDGVYVQGLPGSGQVVAFQANADPNAFGDAKHTWKKALGEKASSAKFWEHTNSSAPIVAIFDILQPQFPLAPSRPIVLLQPRASPDDTFPSPLFPPGSRSGSVYIGVLPLENAGSGSLYALTEQQYPLALFEGNRTHGLRLSNKIVQGRNPKGGKGCEGHPYDAHHAVGIWRVDSDINEREETRLRDGLDEMTGQQQPIRVY